MHHLKRTYIKVLAESGASTAAIQRAAPHASIVTTQKYYIRVEQAALVDAVRRLPFGAAVVRKETA